jgi:hypothetical protein
MQYVLLILNIVSSFLTKVIQTPAEKAKKAWNKFRRRSDENAKKRGDRANGRKRPS